MVFFNSAKCRKSGIRHSIGNRKRCCCQGRSQRSGSTQAQDQDVADHRRRQDERQHDQGVDPASARISDTLLYPREPEPHRTGDERGEEGYAQGEPDGKQEIFGHGVGALNPCSSKIAAARSLPKNA